MLELIVARGLNGAIGLGGKMPWHIPEDLRHFKKVTMGCPVIMGRKTWESIGRPLPGRRNIVVTRNASYEAAGAETAGSIDEALALAGDCGRIFIIGGADLYRQSLHMVEKAWITQIHASPEGDAFFDELPEGEWSCETLETLPATEARPLVEFFVYTRKK